MICCRCNEERKKKDFLNGNDVCYKCVYKEKTKVEEKKSDVRYCRICEKRCGENRWVYCSRTCATIGELKQKRNHWTMLVKSV